MPTPIRFSPSAEADLAFFRVIDRRAILDAIRVHLTDEAGGESRRRKRLKENALAPWELRVGDHRVFYEIDDADAVTVLAVGVKDHNDLFIRGKRFEL